jgi:AhpD family alkylhydroperoxidase
MMSRIVPVVSSNVDAKVATTLSQVKASLGMVPNLFATLAHAPVALDGFLSLSKTLSRGRLSAAQREIVALAVGQENGCQYCVSAHTAMAKAGGVSEADALKAVQETARIPLIVSWHRLRRRLFVSAVMFRMRISQTRERQGLMTA